MKTFFVPAVMALASAVCCGPAQAANFNLTAFSSQGLVDLATDFAVLRTAPGSPNAAIFGNVTALNSFEYRLMVIGNGTGTVSLSLANDSVTLKNYMDLNSDSGWQTYSFRNPYTGSLLLLNNTLATSENVVLSARNFSIADAVVPAVPEPETYAMLLAGLGIMALKRRKPAALSGGTGGTGGTGPAVAAGV